MKKYILLIISLISVNAYCQSPDTLLIKYRQMALDYNYDLKSAENNINASIELEKSAIKDRLPQISGSATYQYTVNPIELSASLPGIGNINIGGDNNNQYGLALSLVQPIYNGGKILNNIKLLKEKTELTKNYKLLVNSMVCYQTDVQYWSTVARLENILIQKEYLSSVDSLVNVISQRVAVGLIDEQQLLMVQVKSNEARVKVLQAQKAFKAGLMSLNSLIGVSLDNLSLVSASLDINQNYQLENNPNYVRPELLIAKNEVNIAHSKKKLVSSNYNPKFIVGVDGSYASPGYNFKKDMDFNGAVYAKLSVPIFMWGKRRNDVSAANIDIETSNNNYYKVEDKVNLEMEKAILDYNQSIESLSLANNTYKVALENQKKALEKYEQGSTSVLEVIDAQMYTLNARESLVKIKLDVQLAVAQYNFYICNY